MILIDIKTIKLYMKYEEIPYYSKKNMRYFLVHNSKIFGFKEDFMLLRNFLDLLIQEQNVKIFSTELSGDEAVYIGDAINCPYWIAEYHLEDGSSNKIFVDSEGYLNIYCEHRE